MNNSGGSASKSAGSPSTDTVETVGPAESNENVGRVLGHQDVEMSGRSDLVALWVVVKHQRVMLDVDPRIAERWEQGIADAIRVERVWWYRNGRKWRRQGVVGDG